MTTKDGSGDEKTTQSEENKMMRRSFLAGVAAAAAGTAAFGRQRQRDYGQSAAPIHYPDADIVVLDKRFAKYKLGNTAIQRLHTGSLWAEGPAWNAVGRYLLWSDIASNVQRRWLAEDDHVSVFRNPSNNSNGNTFDFEGRQVTCEHATRRVVRYEHNGSVTVLADKWQGKPFNAPNDIVVHPDGGVWFTDPGYGSMVNYEGNKGDLLIKEAVYRIDGKTSKLDMVIDGLSKPNGLCFSPDYKKLYICDTGDSAKNIQIFDVIDGKKLGKGREFHNMKLQVKGIEVSGLADGIRADVDGNIWAERVGR